MLRESRTMLGRNFATVLLLAIALVGCGGDDAPAGIRVRDYTVHSKAVDRDMAVKVVVPEGGRPRPLLLFLHGRGGDDLLAPLALPTVELGHVGARVRRLEVGHALRATQVDQDVLVTLWLAAERLQKARTAARAGGQRHAPRK